MSTVHVLTPQNVTIEYPIASVGDRILATLVDGLIALGYYVFAVLLYSAFSDFFDDILYAAFILFAAPLVFYHLLCETFLDGQSLGKKLLKIRVVRLDGTAPSIGNYLMRWVTRFFEVQLFSAVPALIAVVISDKGQRLGDMAAGTCVVKLNQTRKLGQTLFEQLDDDYEIVYPEVRKLNDEDIGIIKDVLLACRSGSRTTDSVRLANKARAIVIEKMGIATDQAPLPFLKTVVRDYNSEAGMLD